MNHKASVSVAMLATLCSSPMLALAQQSPPPGAEAQGGLQEVTVTAQFVKQNLQDTPVAITAMTAAMMEARGQQAVQDLGMSAPNVSLLAGGTYSGPALIGFIRGVGQTDFNPALEPGVGLYVDDVYFSTLTGSLLDLLDLDRVEILRGPQGTLSGKNSIGGSIKLYTKKPGPQSDGYVYADYGSYSAYSVRAASNFTLISDTLYARVSGAARSSNGYVTRLDYGCTHPGSDIGAAFEPQLQGNSCVLGHEGGIHYTTARLALRWLAASNLELNFSADGVNDVSEAAPNVLLGVGPTLAPVFIGTPKPGALVYATSTPLPPIFRVVDGCNFIAYGSGSCDPKSPNNPYVNYSTYTDPNTGLAITPNRTVNSRGESLNIDWQLSKNLDLQSISAYRKYEAGFGIDSDASPFPLQELYQSLSHWQKSQELRLNGKAGELLDYTLGGFYFDQNSTETGRIDLAYVGFDFLHGPDPVDARTWAAFANGIFHMLDNKLDLSLGLRYTDERKTYTYARHNPDGSLIQPCIGPPGTPGNPPNCLISELNGLSNTFKGTRTDYRAALSYKFTNEVMGYVQYSTGYKGGGVNPRPFFNVQAVTFQPETLDAYEVGVKSEFFDHRMRLNAAVFTNKYKAVQSTLNDCTALFGGPAPGVKGPPGVPCLLSTNSGDADVKGAELELNWRPVDELHIDASVGYLDFKFTSIYPAFVAAGPASGVTLDSKPPYSPKLKWNVGVQYDIGMPGGAALTPRVDVTYQDKVYGDIANTPLETIDAYTLANARLTWSSPKRDWQVAFSCQNVTDKLYYITKTDQVPAGAGSAYGAPGMPRTYTLSVKREF